MTSSTEIADLLPIILELWDRGRSFALATVLKAEGATPARTGAKAILNAKRVLAGTVGGGRVEAETQRQAVAALRSKQPVLLDFQLQGDGIGSASPVCGGTMRVLIDPTVATGHEAFVQAAAALQRRERGVWLTRIEHRNRLEVSTRWLAETAMAAHGGFPSAADLVACLEDETAQLFEPAGRASPAPAAVGRGSPDPAPGPDRQVSAVFVEPVLPKPLLLIVGGGHVGQALAALGQQVGFEIAVVDDRPAFTASKLFPKGTALRCGKVSEEVARFPSGADTYIVITTRGHQQDAEALAAALTRPAAYVGMIGSRRKVALMRREFIASGRANEQEFDRVYAPIGLDLGARTVPEIATSIVAQLIAVRRKGIAPRLATT
jgi:xanthine dehydrogenase accessory factor